MQKVTFTILITLLTIVQVHSFAFISTFVEILDILHTVNNAFNSGYESFGTSEFDADEILNPVLSKIDKLSTDIRTIGSDLEIALDKILTHIPLERRIDDDKLKLNEYIVYINDLFEQYKHIIRYKNEYNDETIFQFTRSIISPEFNHIPNILGHIHSIIIPKRSSLKEGFFELLLKYRNGHTNDELCNMDVSLQWRVYNLFNLILITELQSYTMIPFAYWYQSQHNNVSYTREADYAFEQCQSRLSDYMDKFTKMSAMISRDIYRCDPPNLILGENYEEFQGLFTAYLMNTMMLQLPNNWNGKNFCGTTCEAIRSNLVSACYSHNARGKYVEYCTQQQCKGVVGNCKTLKEKHAICESKTSHKRYTNVKPYVQTDEYWETHITAESTNCSAENHFWTLTPLDKWGGNCYNCLCECTETLGTSAAIRAVSFLPQISDIKNNRVVSNIQFVLKDKLIHLQIANAPLLSNGEINMSESTWIPLGSYRYSPENDGEFSRTKPFVQVLEKNVDYAFIDSEQRIINIDEISAGPNYVVTGVRLNRFVNRTEQPDLDAILPFLTKKIIETVAIQLEVHVTPFNYTTGQLNPTHDNPSKWISWNTQPNPSAEYLSTRQEIEVGGKIYDDKQKVIKHYPNVKPNKFIKFKHSEYPGIDSGQTTVPFIDTQSVSDKNNVPLGGIGLIYRSHSGYAGFVAPKVLSIDMTYYMGVQVSPNSRF